MIHNIVFARAIFFLYLAAVWALTLVRDPRILGGILLLLILLSWGQCLRLFRHVLRAAFLFNLTVTIAFAALSLHRGVDPATPLILLNARVVVLTWLTFLFIQRVDLFAALSFSGDLTFFLTLAWSQARLYRKVFEDFQLAMESRSLEPPGYRAKFRMLAAAGRYLVEKSLHDSTERALAMESRLFFGPEEER